MKIESGYTRIVFVFSRYVLKIPKAWHIRYPVRYFLNPSRYEGEDYPKLNSLKDIAKYCCDGWYSNRVEYSYSKNNSKAEGILHVRSLFFSLVLIQVTATEVLHEEHPVWKRILRAFKHHAVGDIDILKACNFCILDGKLKMLDYGRDRTIETFTSTKALQIIEAFSVDMTTAH